MKPRVVLLHLITAAAAMFIASKGLPPASLLAATLLGGGLVAASSNVINCYIDRDIDKAMSRTINRPLPAGRLSPQTALIFGMTLGLIGFLTLMWFTSWLTSLLAVIAFVYYILVYTLWLKRRTYWSSIIGSGAGAFPPLIGWVAIAGRIEVTPLLLFALIVFWTPPHFWSLGIFRRKDYQSAGLGVIPARNTPRWITISSFSLILVSLLVVSTASLGMLYVIVALVTGTVLLMLSIRLQFKEEVRVAHYLYLYSIVYLAVLFGVMMADRMLAA